MLDLPALDLKWILMIVIGASAAVSFGVAQVIKLGLKGWVGTHAGAMPPWFGDALVRGASILSGAACGVILMTDGVGLMLGAGAGALNTLLVWILQRRLKKLAGDDAAATPGKDPSSPIDPTLPPLSSSTSQPTPPAPTPPPPDGKYS